jgi:hypothetical protein
MACQTPQDLDLYLVVRKKEMKSINANTNYKLDIGQQRTICKTTKSMQ